MNKFKFGLQRVLDYRQMLEDTLLGELAAIQAEHARESVRLEEIALGRECFKEKMRGVLAEGDAEKIKQANDYLHDLTERLMMQRAKVTEIANRKDGKTAEVIEAAKDRKALERLKDYKVVAHQRESLHQEQKFLDEMASIRHGRAENAGF